MRVEEQEHTGKDRGERQIVTNTSRQMTHSDDVGIYAVSSANNAVLHATAYDPICYTTSEVV